MDRSCYDGNYTHITILMIDNIRILNDKNHFSMFDHNNLSQVVLMTKAKKKAFLNSFLNYLNQNVFLCLRVNN